MTAHESPRTDERAYNEAAEGGAVAASARSAAAKRVLDHQRPPSLADRLAAAEARADAAGARLAAAWDQGWLAGCDDQQYGDENAQPWTPNPHRAPLDHDERLHPALDADVRVQGTEAGA